MVLWRYQLEDDGDGTLLTQQWVMRNRALFVESGGEDEVARLVVPGDLRGGRYVSDVVDLTLASAR